MKTTIRFFSVLLVLSMFLNTYAMAELYEDMESGTSFRLPTNWKELQLLESDAEYFDAYFESSEDSGACVLYSCDDLWTAMYNENSTEFDYYGFERKDVTNDSFSITTIAKWLGESTSQIEQVTYSSTPFFRTFSISETESAFGVSMRIETTVCMTINNGYCHMFIFSGTENHPLYSDFEFLLESVQFN